MTNIHYNVIVPDDSGYSLDQLGNRELAEFSHLIRMGGKFSWTLQTFYYLKKQGMDVKLSYGLDPDCVNLAHGNYLRSAGKSWNCFTVSLQGDFPRFSLARYHIVQNMDQERSNASFVPFWPQIGQIYRDSNRNGVRTVAYQGRINFTEIDSDRLNADLNPHGVAFVPLSEWKDLSGVDVLVGIRHFGRKRYRRKPASKLVNAWNANIPFIGGWDSAYSYIGVPGEDYLRVSSYNELVKRILDLKENDELYNALVRAGSERAKEYTSDAIAKQWVELLETKVSCAYRAWQCRSLDSRVLYKFRLFNYMLSSAVKGLVRSTYKVALIKRLRDRYYDPVK